MAPPIPPWPTMAWDPAWSGVRRHDAAEAERAGARRRRRRAGRTTSRPRSLVGTPWKELASRSADLDLLVVGARGYGPVRRLLLGSTSAKLARHAACPLLVAPRDAHAIPGAPPRRAPPRGAPATGNCAVRVRAAPEVHLSHRSNWLRAAVLGANDGIVSTASLVLGVAASGASGDRDRHRRDRRPGRRARCRWPPASTSRSARSATPSEADIRLEERELRSDPQGELRELAGIYEQRGLPPALAGEVARPLIAPRARCRRTSRDELGLDERRLARPFQAAWASARVVLGRARHCRCWPSRWPRRRREIGVTVVVTLIALAGLGDLGARLGGAPRRRAGLRVVVWGAVAMAITAAIGALVGTAI